MEKDSQNCNATPAHELKEKNTKQKIKYKFKTDYSERGIESHKDWFSFYKQKSYFKFTVEAYGYFDPRPQIKTNVTSLIVLGVILVSLFTLTISWFHLLLIPFLFFAWGDIYLKLPLDSGMDNESDSPEYGFYMYHIDPIPGKVNFPTCFIWQWGNYKSYDMPWAYTHIRHSILLKDDIWEHELKGQNKGFYISKWKEKQFMIEYNFLDKSDLTYIPTKVYVAEREWRQHWLKWTGLFAKVVRTIDVEFSKEVGSRKGSWKGGTLGCGYNLKENETALECIKRMETERTFR
ncbi:MAG: hypothetical protein ACI9TV_003261 [Sulfurimonas sp.]|jgi:hypothetical protein|uniref:hypothetical protein n=1 Tax=Sulfurimonas sp. TaxID=2022749 RepID=UPI0039E24429